MMVPSRFVALAVTTTLFASGSALHAQMPLKYQFKKGETLKYVMLVAQKGTTKGKDVDVTVIQNQTIDLSWHVQSVDDKGTAKIRMKFDRAKLSVSNGKQTYETASDAKDEPTEPPVKAMFQIAKALATFEATFAMSPQGDIKDISIPASVIKEIKSIAGDKAADDWTEENLKTTLRDNTLALSPKPVGKGMSWKRDVQMKSLYGLISGELEYAWDGRVERDGAKVDMFFVKPKLKIETDPKAKPPVTIKMYETEGQALFDNGAGRLVEMTITQRIEAQAEVDGMTASDRRELTNSFKLVGAK